MEQLQRPGKDSTSMKISKKELQDILSSGNIFELNKRGLYLDGDNLLDQVDFGDFGHADHVSVSINDSISPAEVFIEVYFINNGLIGIPELGRACLIGSKIERTLIAKGYNHYHITNHLIGSDICLVTDFAYIASYMDNVICYRYNLDPIKGISFEEVAAVDYGPVTKKGAGFLDSSEFDNLLLNLHSKL